MQRIFADTTNAAAGGLFILFGAIFAYQAFFGLELGTTLRMGPGYFPLVLALILILLGLVILAQSLRTEGEAIGPIAWRGMLFILPAPVIFGFTVRGLGFVPALFLAAFFASLASERMKPWVGAILAAVVTAFSTLVFVRALGLPFRLFGPWLGA